MHPPTRVLLAGISTRAAAESAAGAGFAVTALDAFGDLDQHPGVRALSLPRDLHRRFTARSAAGAARAIEGDAVVYLSPFENHPAAVRALSAHRVLWGNPPDVLRRVRDPLQLAASLARRGFAVPRVIVGGSSRPASAERYATATAPPPDRRSATESPAATGWLLKRRASGGGRGVRAANAGTSPGRGAYLQERIDGAPGSVVFAAASGRATVLGVSRQLIGERAFGADGFRYCGSILVTANRGTIPGATHAPAPDAWLGDGSRGSLGYVTTVVAGAVALAAAVTEEFGLVGVNGIDFIVRGGIPYPIEVNPRWTASMELVERAYGVSVFGAHVLASTRGELPAFDVASAWTTAPAVGKAIVFARAAVRVGDTRAWLDDPDVRDVPHPGEHIAAGRPVCTVLAEAAGAEACHAALVRQAERIYERLATPRRDVA